MDFLRFCTHALAVTPQTMLRFLPVLIVYVLACASVFLVSDNIYVVYLLSFLLATFGYGFLLVQGLRAALQSLRVTAAPTAGGLLNATTRMVFIYGLAQILLLAFFGTLVTLGFYHVVFPAMEPGAAATLDAIFSGDGTAGEAQAQRLLLSLQAAGSPAVMLFNFVLTMILGLGMALFGVPMAAVSANAVQHSPGHDPIYGLGRYMPHQMALYTVFVAVPSTLFGAVPAQLALSGAGGAAMGAALAVVLGYSLFAMCLPWAAMGVAYGRVRARLARERQAEAMPEIDYEAERARLRELRQTRTMGARSSTVYDPLAAARAARGLGPGNG